MLRKFKNIFVVGVGGTGSFLMPVVMRYLASRTDVNKELLVKIIDGDKYDEGNFARQEFAHSRVGRNKAEVQEEIYQRKFPALTISSVPEYLGSSNIEMIVDGSIIFCCVDNHFCRNLLSKHCQTLNNVILISRGNEHVDGNVQSYFKIDGKEMNHPIEYRHPEIERTNDGDRSEMSCEELHNLPSESQVIFANAMSGTLMACLFYSYIADKNPWRIDDIFFDVEQVKTARIYDGNPE